MGILPKSEWGDGPWQSEPDREEFRHAGLPCLLRRSDVGGSWCGYAAVPPGHKLHGASYQDIELYVHEGLSFSGACQGAICHVPQPGEPDDVWWLGFDCHHAYDIAPEMEAAVPIVPLLQAKFDMPFITGREYRTIEYAREQTRSLAEQLAALGTE